MTLDYLSHIGEETARFTAAARGNFDKPVPSCPEWDVGELSYHVLEAFAFWRQIVEGQLETYKHAEEVPRPSDAELLAAVTAEAARLTRALKETDPATPIWTWSSNKTAGFVPRRMAHEISVHRWDCENAVGDAAPVEGSMAWDGVVEFFEYFLLFGGAEWKGGPVTVLLERTDGDDRLEARSPGSGEAPQATIAATASDLLLTVWGRLPLERLEVNGDPEPFRKLMTASETE